MSPQCREGPSINHVVNEGGGAKKPHLATRGEGGGVSQKTTWSLKYQFYFICGSNPRKICVKLKKYPKGNVVTPGPKRIYKLGIITLIGVLLKNCLIICNV